MKLWLPLTGKAFLPEVPAYVDAFQERGHDVVVVRPEELVSPSAGDVVIRFGGLIRANRARQYTEIHEYHNVSRRSFPRSRNYLKRSLAGTPDGRIFVTDWVRQELNFPSGIAYAIRDQGAAPELLNARQRTDPKFDVVYCGSVSGRKGLLQVIRSISARGYSVGVAGSATPADAQTLRACRAVTFLGQIPHQQVPEFLASGSTGLHYCPDYYPFRYEFGTKVVEYLAAGLPIISNTYPWIEDHSRRERYSYIRLETLPVRDELSIPTNAVVSLDKAKTLSWPDVLRRADIVGFTERIAVGE